MAGIALLLGAWLVLNCGAARAESGSPYGVIEIGSKGVKAFVFDFERAQTDECQKDGDRYLECLDLRQVPAINVSPIKEEALAETVDAVAKQQDELLQRYTVSPERIFVVVSSGLATVPHRERLIAAIGERIAPKNPIDSVSVDEETRYAFDGILQLIPARYRADRRRNAVLIDIGSGNTKGSYIEAAGDSERFVSFSVPWGTTKVSKEIDEKRGDTPFVAAAEQWRREVLLPVLRDEIDRKPGIVNRPRVYLIGGLPWALVTLTQPMDKHKFPRIYVEHINRLYRDAAASDAEARLCNKEKPAVAGSDVERVCNTFTMHNLIAGLQILQALSEEMKLRQRGKLIFFFRDSQFAWPLGYLQRQLAGDERVP